VTYTAGTRLQYLAWWIVTAVTNWLQGSAGEDAVYGCGGWRNLYRSMRLLEPLMHPVVWTEIRESLAFNIESIET
jgi:hypothetical protein